MSRKLKWALAVVVVAAAAWAGYDLGYSAGWSEALFYSDTVDAELRGVEL